MLNNGPLKERRPDQAVDLQLADVEIKMLQHERDLPADRLYSGRSGKPVLS